MGTKKPASGLTSRTADFEKVWRVGVYDAHCHPTDIMDSISRIPDMKAKALTVMSTRAQDQDLVQQTAQEIGIRHRDQLSFEEDDDCHDSDETDLTTEANLTSGETKQYRMIPAFGWHPWFSHQIWDDHDGRKADINATEHYKSVLTPLPDSEFLKSLQKPLRLSNFLVETEKRLQEHPLALIGEIGLDRSFRLPEGPSSMTGDVSTKTGGDEGAYTPGSREGRPLTSYKVNLEQQKMVLKAQLELAARTRRAVSVHSVQAHGLVFEVLQTMWKGHERPSKREMKKKQDAPDAIAPNTINGLEVEQHDSPYPPRVCMHSFSGPAEALRMFLDPKIPADMYISFSECINFSSPSIKKAEEAIKLVPDDKILVESDLHCAGPEMDNLLENIVRRVCEIKGWELVEGARTLKRNWMRFIFGE